MYYCLFKCKIKNKNQPPKKPFQNVFIGQAAWLHEVERRPRKEQVIPQ